MGKRHIYPADLVRPSLGLRDRAKTKTKLAVLAHRVVFNCNEIDVKWSLAFRLSFPLKYIRLLGDRTEVKHRWS